MTSISPSPKVGYGVTPKKNDMGARQLAPNQQKDTIFKNAGQQNLAPIIWLGIVLVGAGVEYGIYKWGEANGEKKGIEKGKALVDNVTELKTGVLNEMIKNNKWKDIDRLRNSIIDRDVATLNELYNYLDTYKAKTEYKDIPTELLMAQLLITGFGLSGDKAPLFLSMQLNDDSVGGSLVIKKGKEIYPINGNEKHCIFSNWDDNKGISDNLKIILANNNNGKKIFDVETNKIKNLYLVDYDVAMDGWNKQYNNYIPTKK